MPTTGEKLAPVELAGLICELGLAVAEANKKLAEVSFGGAAADGATTPATSLQRMRINEAEAELKISIATSTESTTNVSGGLAIQVFNVNASYSKTFAYKEEASSRILVKFGVTSA